MLPVGFETTISADERPQTYALDRAASETGYTAFTLENYQYLRYIHSHSNKSLECGSTAPYIVTS